MQNVDFLCPMKMMLLVKAKASLDWLRVSFLVAPLQNASEHPHHLLDVGKYSSRAPFRGNWGESRKGLLSSGVRQQLFAELLP